MSGELFAPHGPAPLRFSVTLPLSDAEPGAQWLAEGGQQQDGDGSAQPTAALGSGAADPRSPAPVRRPASQSFAAPQLHFCVGPSSLRTHMGGGHSGSGSGSGSGSDSGAVSLTGALERCFLETGLGAAERALVTRLAVMARMQVAEEQLQQHYSAALLRQLQQQPQGGDEGTGAATAQPAVPTRHTQRTGQSDGIGHWDHEEEEEGEEEVPVVQWADPTSGEDVAVSGQPQSEPQSKAQPKQPKLQQAQRSGGALAAWRRVRFTPPPARLPSGAVVPSRRRSSSAASAQPSLGALISALLAASWSSPSESGGSGGSDSGGSAAHMSLGSDSPLSRLYQLASLYHAEHLVYLAKKQASYAALQAAQSREMDVVCAQAQQSEIDDAALGYDDDHTDRDRDRDGERRGSNTSDADGSALDRELLGGAEGDDSHSAAAVAAASSASVDGDTNGRADGDAGSDRTPSPSSLSGPSASGSSLSEAISLLVQSHLVQSSVLEEEWAVKAFSANPHLKNLIQHARPSCPLDLTRYGVEPNPGPDADELVPMDFSDELQCVRCNSATLRLDMIQGCCSICLPPSNPKAERAELVKWLSLVRMMEDEPAFTSVAKRVQIELQLQALHRRFHLKRMWHERHIRPMVVISFLDDALDDICFAQFCALLDPHSRMNRQSAQQRGLIFVRAKNIPADGKLPVFGPSIALILIGHGESGSSSIFSRASKTECKEYSFEEVAAYVDHCKPQVVVLFACEAGSFHPESLMRRLVVWAAHHPASVGPDFSVFCCADSLSMQDSLFGIVGHFVYTLWAYLSQDGIYGTGAKQHVEMLLNDAHVKTKGGVLPAFANAVGQSSAAQVREVHALIVMAYSLFKQDSELHPGLLQQTFFCLSTQRFGATAFKASALHPETIRQYGASFYASQMHSEWGMPANIGLAIHDMRRELRSLAARLRSHDVWELWFDNQTNRPQINLICTPDHDNHRLNSAGSDQSSPMDIDEGDSSAPMHFSLAVSTQKRYFCLRSPLVLHVRSARRLGRRNRATTRRLQARANMYRQPNGRRWREGPSKRVLQRRRNKKRAQARRRARAQ